MYQHATSLNSHLYPVDPPQTPPGLRIKSVFREQTGAAYAKTCERRHGSICHFLRADRRKGASQDGSPPEADVALGEHTPPQGIPVPHPSLGLFIQWYFWQKMVEKNFQWLSKNSQIHISEWRHCGLHPAVLGTSGGSAELQ